MDLKAFSGHPWVDCIDLLKKASIMDLKTFSGNPWTDCIELLSNCLKVEEPQNSSDHRVRFLPRKDYQLYGEFPKLENKVLCQCGKCDNVMVPCVFKAHCLDPQHDKNNIHNNMHHISKHTNLKVSKQSNNNIPPGTSLLKKKYQSSKTKKKSSHLPPVPLFNSSTPTKSKTPPVAVVLPTPSVPVLEVPPLVQSIAPPPPPPPITTFPTSTSKSKHNKKNKKSLKSKEDNEKIEKTEKPKVAEKAAPVVPISKPVASVNPRKQSRSKDSTAKERDRSPVAPPVSAPTVSAPPVSVQPAIVLPPPPPPPPIFVAPKPEETAPPATNSNSAKFVAPNKSLLLTHQNNRSLLKNAHCATNKSLLLTHQNNRSLLKNASLVSKAPVPIKTAVPNIQLQPLTMHGLQSKDKSIIGKKPEMKATKKEELHFNKFLLKCNVAKMTSPRDRSQVNIVLDLPRKSNKLYCRSVKSFKANPITTTATITSTNTSTSTSTSTFQAKSNAHIGIDVVKRNLLLNPPSSYKTVYSRLRLALLKGNYCPVLSSTSEKKAMVLPPPPICVPAAPLPPAPVPAPVQTPPASAPKVYVLQPIAANSTSVSVKSQGPTENPSSVVYMPMSPVAVTVNNVPVQFLQLPMPLRQSSMPPILDPLGIGIQPIVVTIPLQSNNTISMYTPHPKPLSMSTSAIRKIGSTYLLQNQRMDRQRNEIQAIINTRRSMNHSLSMNTFHHRPNILKNSARNNVKVGVKRSMIPDKLMMHDSKHIRLNDVNGFILHADVSESAEAPMHTNSVHEVTFLNMK